MPDFTLQQTGAELQGLINKIAPTEEKVTQLSDGIKGVSDVVLGKESISITDFSAYRKVDLQIVNGNWYNDGASQSVIIPVIANREYKIVGTSNRTWFFSLLKSDSNIANGERVDVSTLPKITNATLLDSQDRYTADPSAAVVFTTPSDCQYISITTRLSATDCTPQSLSSEGVLGLVDDIEKLEKAILVTETTKMPLLANHYINSYGKNVGDYFFDPLTDVADGIYANRFNVAAGQTYRIKGKGNQTAYSGYILTTAANIITRIIFQDTFDVTIKVMNGEVNMYCTLTNYDGTTDGVWRIEEKTFDDSIKRLDAEISIISEKVQDIEDIGEKQFSKTTSLNAEIINGSAYNLAGATIGSIYTGVPDAYNGYAHLRILVDVAKTYVIKGIGSPYAFRFYAFLDKEQKVLSVSEGDFNTRNNPLQLVPPKGADTLIVNFAEYNAVTDGVECVEQYSVLGVYEATQKKWEKATIVTFGDSITQFEDSSLKSYPMWLQDITSANVINVGIGGTQFRARTTPTSSPSNDIEGYAGLDVVSLVKAATTQNFTVVENSAAVVQSIANPMHSVVDVVKRLKGIDWDNVDIVVMFAGTNDWYGGANMGVSDSQNEQTTLGAINSIIRMINTTYPHIQVYWFTPIVRYIGEQSQWNDSNWAGNLLVEGKTLIDYVDAIIAEVRKQNIPVCDLYRTLGWNQHNFKYYFNSSDGTHPNRGLRFIANKVASFIEANKTIDL